MSSERWHYVTKDGAPVSIGTVVAADAQQRGFTVQTADVPDGKIPAVVDGRLVAVDPPTPVAARSLDEIVAEKVTAELDRREADATRGTR